MLIHFLYVYYNDNKTILNPPTFSDYYTVVFVHPPNMESLDIKENFWIGKINATTNINHTFLSKGKYNLQYHSDNSFNLLQCDVIILLFGHCRYILCSRSLTFIV